MRVEIGGKSMNMFGQFKNWVRYRSDNALSRGIGIVLLWVGLLLLVAIVTISFIIWITRSGPNDQETDLFEAVWITLTRSLDPGTFGADVGFRFRSATLVVTLIGLLVLATLIGLVSNAIDRKIDDLRRGRSLVLEHGHTLILGRSQKLSILIKEIVEANLSVRKHSIVVLTSEDKVELEEWIRREVEDLGTCRIVVRRGDTSSLHDLAQVSPLRAKSIIILAPDSSWADAEVVKTSLAVLQVRQGQEEIPVIIEVANEHTASALSQALPKSFAPVITNDVISKVAAHTSRMSGLGAVYQDLMGFQGNEFYFTEVPGSLIGADFASAANCVTEGILVGVKDKSGTISLSPPIGQVINASDTLILLAEDDSQISFKEAPGGLRTQPSSEPLLEEIQREQLLVLGWNNTAPWVLREIDRRVAPGSKLVIMSHPLVADNANEFLLEGLLNQESSLTIGDTTSFPEIYRILESSDFDHVLVLGSMRFHTAVESDASVLLTLMHVRNALDALDVGPDRMPNVVAELNQEDSVDLASVARPDDFIVSQRLVSLLIAQLSENPQLKELFDGLLDPFGTDIVLRPAVEVLEPGTYTMNEISMRAQQRGVVALGWQLELGQEIDSAYLAGRIRLNPPKNQVVHLSAHSRLVLLVPVRA